MRVRPVSRALPLLLALGGCASAIRLPVETDLAFAPPGTTLDDLTEGRALYVQTCSGCHHLHLPRERAPDAWDDVVDEMSRELDTPEADLELIRAYLRSRSAAERGDG